MGYASCEGIIWMNYFGERQGGLEDGEEIGM